MHEGNASGSRSLEQQHTGESFKSMNFKVIIIVTIQCYQQVVTLLLLILRFQVIYFKGQVNKNSC